jgi:D-galactarolactone isomerase
MNPSAPPRLAPHLPPRACDSHIHIFGPQYPIAKTAVAQPPDAPLAAYLAVRDRLGLERAVVVQPTHYGSDNTCTLDAIAALGPSARGVAMVDKTVTDTELERLTRGGICGLRVQMFPGGIIAWDEVETLAARVVGFGWFVQLQFDGREFPEREALIRRLPGRLVIDHTGKFIEPVSVDSIAFRCFLRLLDRGRVWFKIAAPYETSKDGPPRYEDVGTLARALVDHAPERGVWATNWPHVNQKVRIDENVLRDCLIDWAGDGAEGARNLERILVDTPAELYGF